MSTENGKTSSEPEGYRSIQSYMEKKIRNLEKRKNRLEEYQKRQNQGETLIQQQLDALASMATVQGNLEFARDALVHVTQTLTEQERLAKKAEKKAKIDREKRELDQLESMVRAQALLDEMGADELKEAFARGIDGVTLTDEELESLDQLYQAVTPRRDPMADADDAAGPAWPARIRASAENWQHYLVQADRPLQPGGSTFRNVAELLKRLAELPFFTADRQPPVASQPAPPPQEAPPIVEQQPPPQAPEAAVQEAEKQQPPAEAKPAWSKSKHWADEPMPVPTAASGFSANNGGGGFQQKQAGAAGDSSAAAGDADNGGEFIAYSRGGGGRSRGGGGGGFNEHRGGGGRGGGGFRGGSRGGGERGGGRGFGGGGGGRGGGHRGGFGGERASFGGEGGGGHRGGFGGERASFGGESGGGQRGGFRGGRSSYARHNSFPSHVEQQ